MFSEMKQFAYSIIAVSISAECAILKLELDRC